MTSPADELLHGLIGVIIVTDLHSPYVAIGTLTGFDHKYLILDHVDVHDLRDSKTTREKYLVECRELGVRPNRKRAYISRHEVVSFSKLDDVIAE